MKVVVDEGVPRHVVIGWDGRRVMTCSSAGREAREELPPVAPFTTSTR